MNIAISIKNISKNSFRNCNSPFLKRKLSLLMSGSVRQNRSITLYSSFFDQSSFSYLLVWLSLGHLRAEPVSYYQKKSLWHIHHDQIEK